MSEPHAHTQHVVFRIGADRFAVPTTHAREVIRYERPRPLPGAQGWVRGVIHLRGEIVPVCDPLAALGLEPATAEPTRIVVCDVDPDGGRQAGSVGLLVDEVSAVASIDVGALGTLAGAPHPGITGLVRHGDELLALLDLGRLLTGSQLEADDDRQVTAA